MNKVMIIILLAAACLVGCNKEEVNECATLSSIEVVDYPIQHNVDGTITEKTVRFTYSNGNQYLIGDAGDDYSHLSDLDECEYLMAR